MRREPDFRGDDDPPQVLTPRNVAIPLWLSWAITSSLLVAVAYLISTLNDIKSSIKDVSVDRWKKSDQREWSNRLQQANPSIKVPSADQVSKDLE